MDNPQIIKSNWKGKELIRELYILFLVILPILFVKLSWFLVYIQLDVSNSLWFRLCEDIYMKYFILAISIMIL